MSDVWYHDAAQFAARLAEHDGSISALARASGVARTTLQSARDKLGIKVDAGVAVTPDEELLRQNEVLKLEVKRLRGYANKQAGGEIEGERLVQRLENAIAGWAPDWSAHPLPEGKGGDRTAQDLVLCYSDLHAAEVVSSEETRGLNEYNWDIMLARMNDLQASLFSHVDHFGFDIATFHIHMLGDMLSGNIHQELAMTNDRPLAEAVIDLAEAHIPWLLTFADYFEGTKIRVAGVPGNHPRAWIKPSAKLAQDNADWIFYKTLEIALRGHPQFEFDIQRGSMSEQIIAGRWRTLLMHGDGIRSSMPGVPWAGVLKRIATLEAQFQQARKPIDYFELGHFHQEGQFSGIGSKAWLNGSLKGVDEYSLKQFGSGRGAEQIMTTFHPRRGWTGQHPLQLQPVQPASEGWS